MQSFSTPINFPFSRKTFQFGNHAVQLLLPDAAAIREAFKENKDGGEKGLPFWSKLWPASVGLCSYITEHPEIVLGKQVLELGAGLGLPSLLAAHFTPTLSCTDIDKDAVQWAKRNAEENGVGHIKNYRLDWTQIPPDIHCDTLLLSDVNYEPEAFDVLQQVFQRFLQSGTEMLLSTPQRLMAKPFIERLAKWIVDTSSYTINLDGIETQVSVFRLRL